MGWRQAIPFASPKHPRNRRSAFFCMDAAGHFLLPVEKAEKLWPVTTAPNEHRRRSWSAGLQPDQRLAMPEGSDWAWGALG